MRLELDTDLLALLPPWYRRILDYQQLCLAEGKELEALAARMLAIETARLLCAPGSALWAAMVRSNTSRR